MKKTFVKLGLLALALAFVLVSCAQPTEEAGGPNAPTIIRLYLDRDDATLEPDDEVEIRVAKKTLVPANYTEYPYPQDYRAGAPVWDAAKVNTASGTPLAVPPLLDGDRGSKIAIPHRRPNNAPSVLLSIDPKSTYLTSGLKTLQAPVTVDPVTGVTDAGSSIQVNAKGIYYVDFELIDLTVASKDRGSVYSKSISGYVELTLDASGGANGSRNLGPTYAQDEKLPDATYLYTDGKHGFNDKSGNLDGDRVIWNINNGNIKTVSLKPGINELYLSYFSYNQYDN
ncbi:MAG: hypothetical protein LBG57_03665 [Treponema sp.]|nr:hypothetical protein [Treponema sp.]